MAKLGYTWYPKDWGNSESVFELSLSERGLYRELIDLAMMNDNKTEIKLDTWCRKFSVSVDELKSILGKLSILKLIEITGEKLFIPSCESRLKMVRGGSKGGKNKPTVKGSSKPIVKPIASLEENNSKPIVKQREIETKIETKNKENIIIIDNALFSNDSKHPSQWKEEVCINFKLKDELVNFYLDNFESHLITMGEQKNSQSEFKKHFIHWLKKQNLSEFSGKRPIGKTNQI